MQLVGEFQLSKKQEKSGETMHGEVSVE